MDQQNHGAPNPDEATVMAMLGDWREEDALKEEPINIDELLQTSAEQNRANNSSIQSQAASAPSTISPQQTLAQTLHIMTNSQSRSTPPPAYQQHPSLPQKVPTFSSSANRPSVLDLSTTGGIGINGHNPHGGGHPQQQQQQQRSISPHHHQQQQQTSHSPHSPHHSPYASNQPVFNYNNTAQREQHSPVSPHTQQLHSPMSPHQRSVSPHHGDQVASPMSPHMPSGQMSPHHQMIPAPPPLSPHGSYARSVSPHSHHGQLSPVSPHGQQMSNHSSAGMSPHHPGMHGSGAMSPHHMSPHTGSVSPVHRQLSPAPGASSVFSRYTGSPVSMHSGNSSDTDSYYVPYSAAQLEDMRKRGINPEKDSHLYKAKRERNNVAVRKSREKKKQREQETEKRVKELSDENNLLQSKLDIALKEMNLLKNLYKNIGVQLPMEARSKLENELAKFK